MSGIPNQCRICMSFDSNESLCKIYEQLPGEYGRESVVECVSFIQKGSKEEDDLDLLLQYIDENPAEVEQHISKAVDRVLTDYENKYKILIVGIARRKIKSIIKMVDIVDSVLDRIGAEGIVEGMAPAQAIRLLSELNHSMNNDLTFIMKLVNPDTKLADLQMWVDARTTVNMTTGISIDTDKKAEEILRLSGASRDKIRDAFDALLHQIDTDDAIDVLEDTGGSDELE